MLELTDRRVTTWANQIRVGDRRLAELDLRLVDLLGRCAANRELHGRTACKGGTALNKLYFEDAARLSVDLDKNALGTRDDVQGARKLLRNEAMKVFRDQDPAFQLSHDHSWDMVRVSGRYQPLAGGTQEKIKLEISMVERIPLLGIVDRPLRTPDGVVRIRTYPVDELLATKWRAFYARSKGRDLYDLVTGRSMIRDPDLVRKMTLYYFLRGGIEFDPDTLRANIKAKAKNRVFETDLATHIRGDVKFSTRTRLRELPKSYRFMFELDRADGDFVALSRHLLGKVGIAKGGPLTQEREPLRVLFDGHAVTDEVLGTPIQDLVPFRKRNASAAAGASRGAR